MTRGDKAVETAADKLESVVRDAQASGGVKAKAGDAFAEDPAFLRKLKPSLVAARMKGDEPEPAAPSGPQLARPKPRAQKKKGGSNPLAVVGAALAAGYLLAKAIDWRGHAHPRL
jgi:hypothetical protein